MSTLVFNPRSNCAAVAVLALSLVRLDDTDHPDLYAEDDGGLDDGTLFSLTHLSVVLLSAAILATCARFPA